MHPLLVVLLLAGCGDKDDTQIPEDTQPDDAMDWTLEDLDGVCSTEDHVGWFELAQWEDADPTIAFSTVTGVVMDGVIPTTILFEEITEGDCTLWRRINPFCDPGCDTDEVCTHDGECVPYPAQLDVGTVTVEGLASAVAMEPDGYANYWDTTVPYPLFEPGGPVRLRSESGLELRGLGVDTLLVEDPAWHITRGEDLEVAWTPGASASRVTLSFNVDQHGNSPITMRCEVADTGSASVPSAVLEALLDYGVSGFASGWMRRGSADRTSSAHGCVDLQVYSHRGTELTVDGHIPCTWDGDCPDGWSCDIETNTCVEP